MYEGVFNDSLGNLGPEKRYSLARTLIVKPSQRALCGHFCMSCRKFSLVLKVYFSRSYLNGHVRSECGSGGVKIGAKLLWEFMIFV